jgi:hypothetical protein
MQIVEGVKAKARKNNEESWPTQYERNRWFKHMVYIFG